jgi:8-amino-7-oxononanoate synthase
MAQLPEKLRHKLEERTGNDTFRSLISGEGKIDFVSNDYLGMAKEESIFREAVSLLEDKGCIRNGSTGSRLLSGQSRLSLETENYLAGLYQAETALLFNSGYDANLGFFSCVPQRGDLVLFDEYIHASMRDGIRMGTARSLKFRHNDLEDLAAILRRIGKDRDENAQCYVATESVFSMDGDSPDLSLLMSLCNDFKCKLVLDEAHAIPGMPGVQTEIKDGDMAHKVLFARIVTFGKAAGVQGAAVLGSEELKSYLVNFARSFIYTTALPPMTLASVTISCEYLNSDKGMSRKKELVQNIKYFKRTLEQLNLKAHFIGSDSPIHSCIIPGNNRVKEIANTITKKGFDVRPILSPTVPEGKERIRFCLHSFNTQDEIMQVLSILANAIDKKIHV